MKKTKPVLNWGESHTARQDKGIALLARPVLNDFFSCYLPSSSSCSQNFQQRHELKSSSIAALPLRPRPFVHKIMSSAVHAVSKRLCAPLMIPPSDSFSQCDLYSRKINTFGVWVATPKLRRRCGGCNYDLYSDKNGKYYGYDKTSAVSWLNDLSNNCQKGSHMSCTRSRSSNCYSVETSPDQPNIGGHRFTYSVLRVKIHIPYAVEVRKSSASIPFYYHWRFWAIELQRPARPVRTKWMKWYSNAEALFLFWPFKLSVFQFWSSLPLSHSAFQFCQSASCFISFSRSSASCFLFSQKVRFETRASCSSASLFSFFVVHPARRYRSADENRLERLHTSFIISFSPVAPTLFSSQANKVCNVCISKFQDLNWSLW